MVTNEQRKMYERYSVGDLKRFCLEENSEINSELGKLKVSQELQPLVVEARRFLNKMITALQRDDYLKAHATCNLYCERMRSVVSNTKDQVQDQALSCLVLGESLSDDIDLIIERVIS